jgi:hypothetical protein
MHVCERPKSIPFDFEQPVGIGKRPPLSGHGSTERLHPGHGTAACHTVKTNDLASRRPERRWISRRDGRERRQRRRVSLRAEAFAAKNVPSPFPSRTLTSLLILQTTRRPLLLSGETPKLGGASSGESRRTRGGGARDNSIPAN